MLSRVLLSITVAVVALLVGEGLLSLFADTSIRQLIGGEQTIGAVAPREQQDEERFAAAASNPGPYRVHDDPRVGYVLKSSQDAVTVEKIQVRSDELGLRRRPANAPEVEEDALRVVVLGDSVAFGWNLQDPDTLAAQLEVVLNEVRGPEARPVRCRTVAIPGWNARNSVSFLVDHLDALRPDHVLFLPVENDLEDGDGVYATGHRRNQGDLCNPDPWLVVNQNHRYLTVLSGRVKKATGNLLNVDQVGPNALLSSLSPESSRRVDELTDLLLDLRRRLQLRDATLHLVPHQQNLVHRLLRARLAARGATIPEIALLERVDPDADTQGDDPHPNATASRVFALWTAQSLLDSGVIDRGADHPLPSLPDGYSDRRSEALSGSAALAWFESHRSEQREALWPEVNDETGKGARQLYGGIRLDGSMGPRLLAVMAPGRMLEVALAPLEDRLDLYPIDVRVEVDGIAIGTLTVSAEPDGGHAVATLPIPDGRADSMEVRLIADSWVMASIFGKSWPVSCDFLWLRTSP